MSPIRHRRTPRLLSWSCVSFLLVLWLSPQTASAVDLTGLSLTPSNPTLNVNDTLQLIATGSYDNGTQLEIAHAKQVSAGTDHTCALSADGTVRCWGSNEFGQLGNGTTTDSSSPVTVSGISTAVGISAYGGYTCALLANGTVQCWGRNVRFSSSIPTSSLIPVTVSGINTAVAVSAGGSHTCAVLADGTIKCWGKNFYRQLGNGTTIDSWTPVTVSGINTAVAVDAGSGHTCALLADATVWCWGQDRAANTTTSPISISGISTAVAITAGYGRSCAVLADGTVRCADGISSAPYTVSGIDTAVAVSAGDNHTCAVLVDGTLRCWGYNGNGVLGDGTTTITWSPVTVSGISNAMSVSAGYAHTCAVLADGTLRCWGYNYFGQLGIGTLIHSSTPVIASGISSAVGVSVGSDHTCAVVADGTLRCWGSDDFGELGIGTLTFTGSSGPFTVSGINTAVAVSAGFKFSCAVLTDGTLRCWGNNYYGKLGNGTTIQYSTTPVSVSGLSTAVAVSAGYSHACAVLTDGTVWCWGSNAYGQLGDGAPNGWFTSSSIPVPVSGISNAVAVSVAGLHSCAVLADGTIKCWGANHFGELGNGSTAYPGEPIPVSVSGINTAVAVSAGGSHTCALLADGTIKCWGNNFYRQLGNGTTIDSWTPVTVSGINTAVAVDAGSVYTCALLADGTLRCWGSNEAGQLGNGTYTDSSTPVVVSGIGTAVAVDASATGGHSCALLADSTPRCWGSNEAGQLGIGTLIRVYLPTITLGYHSLDWSTSNPAVASVDATGKLQALAPGTTLITASTEGFSATTTVTVMGTGQPPVTTEVNLTVESGKSITWTPKATDPDGDPITCRLGTPPTNGTATIASNCASGTYQSTPGFIGTDSFTYIANDGQYDSNPGTVTVAVTEPPPTDPCLAQYPVSQFSQTGKEGTITISFTGNITAHTNKVVKICPGTPLKYQTSSTQGPVVCQVKNNTTRGSGSLKINDHIKCTDKPAGKDKVQFKVKSGVNK